MPLGFGPCPEPKSLTSLTHVFPTSPRAGHHQRRRPRFHHPLRRAGPHPQEREAKVRDRAREASGHAPCWSSLRRTSLRPK
eukprot:6188289-Pleurochrysis_carterae.AAC.5